MHLIEASLSYGDVPLLERVDFALAEGERVGLIGRNGAGKSSLLRVLAGQERLDSWEVLRRQGIRWAYVEQEPQFDGAHRVREAVEQGLGDVLDWLKRVADPAPGEDLDALHNAIDTVDGWRWEQHLAQSMAAALRLQGEALLQTLSGGRAQACRVGSGTGGAARRFAAG
jgi:ATP-binding cassette subfamily F protein uup